MKKLKLNFLLLFIALWQCLFCVDVFAQSGTVCSYAYDCDGDGDVDCSCSNPSQSGTFTATQYGNMNFHITVSSISYSCCGNSHSGGASASVTTSGGSSLGGASTSGGTNSNIVTASCVKPGDTFNWYASGTKGSYSISVSYSNVPSYIDTEPNNTIATAMPLAENATATGNIGYGYYTDDNYDYYKIVAAEEGEITATAYFQTAGRLYLKNKSGGTLSSAYTDIAGSISVSYDCFAQNDTLILQIDDYNSECGGYTLSYDLQPPPYTNDTEANNTIATAIPLAENDTIQGRIGYGYYANDTYDYYKIVAAEEGEITATAYFQTAGRLYLKNKSGETLSSAYTDIAGSISVSYDCFAQNDTLILQIDDYNSECGGYTLSYDLQPPPYTNDTEANNTIATALPLAENDTVQGRIGYGYYSNDYYDYYKIVAADEGAITATAYFQTAGRLHLLNKSGTTLSSTYTDIAGAVSVSYDCFAKNDTLILRIQDYYPECSGYSLSYDLQPPPYTNDTEANNTIATALPLAENDTVQGRIGYGYYSNDAYDYYKIINTGSAIKITASFETSSYLYLYNKNGTSIGSIYTSTPGTISLSKSCLGASDTLFYARISDYNSTCSGYTLFYEQVPYVYANDTEPNGGTSSAILLTQAIAKQGQLYSSDTYDYYKIIANASGFLAVECNFDIAGMIKLYNSSGTAIAAAEGILPEASRSDEGSVYIYKDCINGGETYYVRVSKINSNCTGYAIQYHINEENTFVSGNPIPENVYYASNNLSSNGKVFPDSSVTFVAGQFIKLQAGFWAKEGSNFHAYISDCAPAVAKTTTTTVAVENPQLADIQLFPNPNKGTFTLSNADNIKGNMSLLNTAGQVIHTQPLSEGNSNIQIPNLQSGFYFIYIQPQGQAAIVKKMVVVQE
ncbi:MAG: T9SS type A sorting domain-containing protein [Bacteroidetes bacterium]|nr:T9SS type A sorting domain-containing protein [Bacteroidota bacterium]